MQTIQIKLDAPEVRGLYKLAEAECRPIREQVRHIVRETLRTRGLLTEDASRTEEEVRHASAH